MTRKRISQKKKRKIITRRTRKRKKHDLKGLIEYLNYQNNTNKFKDAT